MINLPSPSTLRAYTGKSMGEIGFTHLVEERLKLEARRLSDIEKLGSLQVEEMTIKPKEKFNKKFWKIFWKSRHGKRCQRQHWPASQQSSRLHVFRSFNTFSYTRRHIHGK